MANKYIQTTDQENSESLPDTTGQGGKVLARNVGNNGWEFIDQGADDPTYTPTNFTPTDVDIDGYLEGIDSAISELPSAREIAFELINPSKLTHMFVLGDSRLNTIESDLDMGATQIPWAGPQLAWSERDTSGHLGIGASSRMNIGGDTTIPSTYLPGNVNDWAFTGAVESEFTGANDSNLQNRVGFAQFFSGQLVQSIYPNTYARLDASQDAKYCILIYKHPIGHTTPDVSLSLRGGTGGVSAPGNIQSPPITNSVGTGTWEKIVTDIPTDYDWTGAYLDPNTDAEVSMTVANSAPTIANEVIAFASRPWFETDKGTIPHVASTSGRSIEGWLDDAILPPQVISELIPTFGEHRLFWIDLGTNNYASNDRAQHLAQLQTLIAKIRVGSPNAGILMTTSYPASVDVGVPYYVLAARDLAALDPTVLLIDTYEEMPDYTTGNGLGYYTDAYHYNTTGKAAYFFKIGELIEAYAGGVGGSAVDPVYSPVNYIPTNATQDGYFEGIDNAFSDISSDPVYSPVNYIPTNATQDGYFEGIDNAFSDISSDLGSGLLFEWTSTGVASYALDMTQFTGVKDLVIITEFATTEATNSRGTFLTFNGDSGTNYDSSWFAAMSDGTTNSSGVDGPTQPHIRGAEVIGTTNADSGSRYFTGTYEISNWEDTSQFKSVLGRGEGDNGTVQSVQMFSGKWESTAAIATATFTVQGGGNIATGSTIRVYSRFSGSLAVNATFNNSFNQWGGDIGPSKGSENLALANLNTLTHQITAVHAPVDGDIATYQVTIDIGNYDSWIGTFQVLRASTFLTVISPLTETTPFNFPANYNVFISDPAGAASVMSVNLTNNSGGGIGAVISVEQKSRLFPVTGP